jgi:transposase
MRLHANARLSVKGRELLVDRIENAGWSLTKAAEAAGVSDRTACKWLARYRARGLDGLVDRSSAPQHVANRVDERRVQVVAALRRLRMTGAEIAEVLGMAHSTVSGILTRIGMGKLGRLGLEPAQRYERDRPGELVHIDVKELGRIGPKGAGHRMTGSKRGQANRGSDGRRSAGWEFVHVARGRRDPPGLRLSEAGPASLPFRALRNSCRKRRDARHSGKAGQVSGRLYLYWSRPALAR